MCYGFIRIHHQDRAVGFTDVRPQPRIIDNFISGVSVRRFQKINKDIQWFFKQPDLVHQSHAVMHIWGPA